MCLKACMSPTLNGSAMIQVPQIFHNMHWVSGTAHMFLSCDMNEHRSQFLSTTSILSPLPVCYPHAQAYPFYVYIYIDKNMQKQEQAKMVAEEERVTM